MYLTPAENGTVYRIWRLLVHDDMEREEYKMF